MIRITYEFATEHEALDFLAGHQPVVTSGDTAALALQTSPTQAPAAPRGRGRPPKAATPAPAQEPVAAAPEPAAPVATLNAPAHAGETVKPATAAPTADTIRAALMKVFQASGGQGAAAATAILKKSNATRVSDIKPEQYADFLKACA